MRKETKFIPIVLIFSLLFLFSPKTLLADVLYLKNGRSIEGIIKGEDQNNLELEVSAGTIRFEKNEIDRIDRVSAKEIDALRKKWEKQKEDRQKEVFRQKLEEAEGPQKVQFSRDSQGITVSVLLNNKINAALLLDTGASIVVLRKNIAQNMGIDVEGIKQDMELKLADGRKAKAKYFVLESVKVENVEANNVEAAILLDSEESKEFGLGDGLLGMSFLEKFNFKVDHKEKRLILEKLVE